MLLIAFSDYSSDMKFHKMSLTMNKFQNNALIYYCFYLSNVYQITEDVKIWLYEEFGSGNYVQLTNFIITNEVS